jgi:hypothetical protein
LGKTVRLRDKDPEVRSAAAVLSMRPRAAASPLGGRVSNEFTVLVWRVHYRKLHHSGDEAPWRRLNIDPASSRAQALAAHARRWRTRASDAAVSSADAGHVSSRSMLNEMMLCEELSHSPIS